MLEIDKYIDERGYYTFLVNVDGRYFTITFAGNLDLYWGPYDDNRDNDKHEYIITKENYYFYSLIEELYESIKNYRAYNNELNDIYKNIREFDKYNDKKLFKDNKIDYHSDDDVYEESSRLLIERVGEVFKITFIRNKNNHFNTCFVGICNSGGRYRPFNINFMAMYNKLKEYDKNNYQIHIEEYLYKKRKKK